MRELAVRGRHDEAITLASTVRDPFTREGAYADIASALALAGAMTEANAIFSRHVSGESGDRHRRRAAESLAQVHQFDEAMTFIDTISDAEEQVAALVAVGTALSADAGAEHAVARERLLTQLRTATATLTKQYADAQAQLSNDRRADSSVRRALRSAPRSEDRHLSAAAMQLAALGAVAEATQVMEGIAHARFQASAAGAIVATLIDQGRGDEADTFLARFVSAAQDRQDPIQRDRMEALDNVVAILAERGFLEQALAVARSVEDAGVRDSILARLPFAIAQHGDVDRALAVTQEIGSAGDRSVAYAGIADALRERGDAQAAREVLGEASTFVAEQDPTADNDFARRVLAEEWVGLNEDAEALRLLKGIADPTARVWAIATTIPAALTEVDDAEESFPLEHELLDRALRERAFQLLRTAHHHEARAMALRIQDLYERVDVLTEIAQSVR